MPRSRSYVTLIANPAACGAARLRAQLPAISSLVSARGFSLRVLETDASEGSAERLARTAREDSAIVLAAGGDGTVHGVLQALACTGADPGAVLGVVPLGTANALARNLGLSLDPLEAVKQLLTYEPVRIPVGEVTAAGESRFFVVMAGCGPDGALVRALSGVEARRFKARFGRTGYYVKAAHLFGTRSWPTFTLEYKTVDAPWRKMPAVAVMAARLPNLGGLFRGLTPRAALLDAHLHLQVLGPPAHLSLPAWFSLSRLGLGNPWHRTLDVEAFRCTPLGTDAVDAVYAQADAEPVGAIPCSARIVPDALTLLMPPR